MSSPLLALLALPILSSRSDQEMDMGEGTFEKNVWDLLQAGTDINKEGSNGHSLLAKAAEMGYTNSVKLLLKAGADTNDINKNIKTVLLAATEWGDMSCIKLLPEKGAENKHIKTILLDNSSSISFAKAGFDNTLGIEELASVITGNGFEKERKILAVIAFQAVQSHADTARRLILHHEDMLKAGLAETSNESMITSDFEGSAMSGGTFQTDILPPIRGTGREFSQLAVFVNDSSSLQFPIDRAAMATEKLGNPAKRQLLPMPSLNKLTFSHRNLLVIFGGSSIVLAGGFHL